MSNYRAALRLFTGKLPAGVAALALVWSSVALAQQPAFTPNFQSEGPAPTSGLGVDVGSRDAPPDNGTAGGAVQTVVIDPSSSGTMFVGATNGGIWVTRNSGVSWTALTDKQASLSIASLAYNSTNTQILYAGIGLASNGHVGDGSVASRGGARTGILQSTDAGSTWAPLSNTVMAPLVGKSVVGVAGSGTTLLAATAEPNDAAQRGAQGYGLYRSVAGGTFALVAGLPTGAATSLVGKGTSGNPYYVAVNADTSANSGVYRSTDAGASWTLVRQTANQIGRLAIAPDGAVAVAVYANNRIAGLSLSQNGGTTWKDLTAPAVNNGGQASTNLAIAIDPTNSNVVYVAGDAASGTYGVAAFRVTLQANGTSAVESLTGSGTADNSTVHPDARGIAFDAAGRLILVGDGGVYARSNPRSAAGGWTGLNNGLSVYEPYVVAYDSVSKRLVVAAQDNGPTYQTRSRAAGYTSISSGDGTTATVNDRTFASSGQSVLYSSSQELGNLTRTVVDRQGRTVSSTILLEGPTNTKPEKNFVNVDATHTDFLDDGENGGKTLPFFSRVVLNRNDPQRIALGTNYVYVTTDALLSDSANTTPLTNLGTTTTAGGVTALAYGTQDNVNAVLAGVRGTANNRLFYSSTATGGSLSVLAAYSGEAPTDVVFDGRSSARFFAADGTNVYRSNNSGTSFDSLTANLTALDIGRPVSVEFISNNGVNALLVGGLVNVATALSPIAVAQSDGTGTLSGWAAFGRGLPNTVVNQLTYNTTADVLAIGLFGRGAWTLYDVTSYFSTATVLRYGLADNDSAPDATFLTGARALEKRGTGTLTIAGTSAYTGTTTVSGGTLQVTGSIASSSGLTVDSGATLVGTGTVPATTNNGTVAPGTVGGTLTVNGNFTQGSGGTYRAATTAAGASDRLNVTGTASLAGALSIVAAPGTYASGARYTLLNATGGLNGSFARVSSNYTFLQPAVTYGTNAVSLTLTPGGFAQGAASPGQSAVGAVLDRNASTASGDFATVLNALGQMTAGQAPAVLESLSGQSHAGQGTVSTQTTQLFMTNFAQQAGGGQSPRSGGGSGGRIALAEACDDTCDVRSEDAPWSAWGGALGGVGTVAGDANARGVSFNIGGFAAGIDRRFDADFLAGVTVGYATSTQYTQGVSAQSTGNTFQVGLYGSQTFGSVYVDGLAGYARTDSQTTRSIDVPGLATRKAIGFTSTDQFFGQIESGYRFDLGGEAEAFLTPFARVQGSTARQAGFTESGADSLNLIVAAQTTNSLRTVLGAQLGGKLDAGWREKIAMTFRLGWSHEHADTARPVTASFVGAPASSFTTTGAAAPREGAVLGLAATTAIAEATSAYFRYDGEVAGGNTSHIFSAGVRMVW